MRATIKQSPDGSLEFYSPYDPGLVADLKNRIPYSDRRWDASRKCWLIAANKQGTLEDLCLDHLGTQPFVQTSLIKQAQTNQTQLFKVEYIGAPKEREDGSVTATGFTNGNWNIIFPQDILKGWFELGGSGDAPQANNTSTLYGLLGVKRDCSGSEVKSGYRKMARRWHPDVNKDADAVDMMKRINDAYQVLSNPQVRRKYDAGLALEASLKNVDRTRHTDLLASDWRPPIRCGWLLVKGQSALGRFTVEKILQWEDVVNASGLIMVTSWPMGNDHFEVNWV